MKDNRSSAPLNFIWLFIQLNNWRRIDLIERMIFKDADFKQMKASIIFLIQLLQSVNLLYVPFSKKLFFFFFDWLFPDSSVLDCGYHIENMQFTSA